MIAKMITKFFKTLFFAFSFGVISLFANESVFAVKAIDEGVFIVGSVKISASKEDGGKFIITLDGIGDEFLNFTFIKTGEFMIGANKNLSYSVSRFFQPILGREKKRFLVQGISNNSDDSRVCYTVSVLATKMKCEDKKSINILELHGEIKNGINNFFKAVDKYPYLSITKNSIENFYWKPWRDSLWVNCKISEAETLVTILFSLREKEFIAWQLLKTHEGITFVEYASDEELFWLDEDGDGIFDSYGVYDDAENKLHFYKTEVVKNMFSSR